MPANFDASDLYWEHFGMTHDPFTALSERYFYPLPEWDEQAQLLEHTTLYNNLFVIVQGPRGSGKTTFMEQLQQRLSASVSCYQIDGDSELSPDELLKIIGHAYSLPELPIGRLPRADLFKLQISAITRSARHCVLMIDDAHLLPIETLHALFLCVKEQSQGPAYFHLVLFTEPTISHWKNTLDWQDKETYLQEIEMPRLDPEMAEKYLDHRLHAAGLMDELPISPEDIGTITEEADGLIGEINHLAKNHLISLCSPKRRYRASALMSGTAMMVGIGIVVAVILGVFVWQAISPDEDFTSAEAELSLPTQTAAVLPKPEALTQNLATESRAEEAGEEQQQDAEQVSYLAPITAEELQNKVLASEIAAIDPKALLPKVTQRPMNVAAQGKKQAVPKATVNKHSSAHKVIAKPAVVANNHYVIQVFATHDRKHAEKFIRQHQLSHKAIIKPAPFAGKPGFLVLVGQYQNERAAHVGLAQLSTSIRQLHPWVRAARSIG